MPRLLVFICVWVCFAVSCGAAQSEPLERLLSTETDANGISVTVPTGGCTSKSDFEVSSHPAGSGKAEIEFKRLKPDDCKGNFPRGLKLNFSWNDLKLPPGTTLVVKNPTPASNTGQERKLNKGTMVAVPDIAVRKIAKAPMASHAKKRHSGRTGAARTRQRVHVVRLVAPRRHHAAPRRWLGTLFTGEPLLRCEWRRASCCRKHHARSGHRARRHRRH
jgi:hypothetical protein